MIRILIAAPFLALMVLFALSNPAPVKLGIWPTDYVIEVPISLAILAGLGIGFFFGALLLWVSAVAAKARARRAERKLRQLAAEIDEMKVRVIRPVQSPTSYGAPAPVVQISPSSRSLAPIP